MTQAELTLEIIKELIRKSGVREWEDQSTRDAITLAAIEMAGAVWYSSEGSTMALPDYFRVQSGTAKTIKNSGGDAAITLASLANNAARQSVKLDLGATRAERYLVKATFEIAATPTAGNVIDLYWAPSTSATAGTDNPANATGTDAAYAGYSANLDASVKQLAYIGSFVCTAQAIATVQAAIVGMFAPQLRYGSLVVHNKSGAALHSTETNQAITLIPIEGVVEDT
jgi:hypothetical protein